MLCIPQGNFESSADIISDITVNTAIGAPLLSRFDLVLVLLDKGVQEWDEVRGVASLTSNPPSLEHHRACVWAPVSVTIP